MDLATFFGLIGALISIGAAILMGGSAIVFVNLPGLIIVVGGSIAITLMKFPIAYMLNAFKIGMKAFFHRSEKPIVLIEQAVQLATVARKKGLIGLEEHTDIQNEFFKKGIQMVVDGHDPELVHKTLSKDIYLTLERHEQGQNIFKAIGDVAPAMGMIGTLIGLVQMMSNMDDPKQIGPAMAVALLTTLYGAIIANTIALPIANKLAIRSSEERLNNSLIVEGITAIHEGLNPRVMEELLKRYLPESKRESTQKETS
ncbi:MAG: flagellar motor protein PomA [Thermodesulfobacteriota bacterium]|nr:flagellar motor protein PomA [Thermodesulfobacteriota bacterium]